MVIIVKKVNDDKYFDTEGVHVLLVLSVGCKEYNCPPSRALSSPKYPLHSSMLGLFLFVSNTKENTLLTVHQACSLHFGLDLIMELTRH
jgi:hypothetical protein